MVTQSTIVIEVKRAERESLRESLARGNFEYRSVPHALFSVKGEGVVATLYQSGKLVIQGHLPLAFAEKYLGRAVAADTPAPRRAKVEIESDSALVGSDEVGKGDYFGPLVVAAVRLEAAEIRELEGSHVRDSKTLTDDGARRIGAALRSRYPHAIARLDPREYNALHDRPGKLNDMLANLHAEVIAKLHRPGIRVLVDRFANEKLMVGNLAGLDIRLAQRTKAESHPAVAAASIIAREAFLQALHELSDRYGVELRKGAGPPADAAARELVALHGARALDEVAKVHFKNTQRIVSRGRGS